MSPQEIEKRAHQTHSDLASAHTVIADATNIPGMTEEGYDMIIRAMAHIRSQMAAISVVLNLGGWQ